MTLFTIIYTATWMALCVAAVTLMIQHKIVLELFQFEYRILLFQKWKLVTFTIALTGIAIIAPYTGDPTWDYMDAVFMSVLTFLTAPWVVGVMFRFIYYEKSWVKLYVAICVWMFSASWSYDAYLLLRDGVYPMTWLSNIFASSVLYFCAGLFWSLEWKEGRGVHFSFTEKKWLQSPSDYPFGKVIWYGLPFALLVSIALGSFLI